MGVGTQTALEMVVTKVSPPSSQTTPTPSQERIHSLTLSRRGVGECWGFVLGGGWQHGAWLGVDKVEEGSPAQRGGLQDGDLLVQVGDSLVIFLQQEEVESILEKAGLTLNLTVERGPVSPMTPALTEEPATSISRVHNQNDKGKTREDGRVTIVINKEKGVWARR